MSDTSPLLKSLVVTRASNCAAAAMLGDAMGAAYEGHGFEEVLQGAGPLGCRAHKAASHMGVYNLGDRLGCYTDDTNSAVGILRSLTQLGRVDGGDIAYRHARQWLDGYSLDFRRGYPGSAQAMMLETLAGSDAKSCATTSFPDGSYANGAAMKVWPIAVGMHDATLVPKPAFYEAVRASCCFSHVHPQGIDAAASLAETIRWGLHYKLPAAAPATTIDPPTAAAGGEEKEHAPPPSVMEWTPADGAALLQVAHEACQEAVVKSKVGELLVAFAAAPPAPQRSNKNNNNSHLTPEQQYKQEVTMLHSMLKPICGQSLGFQIEAWAGLVCALAVAARHGPHVSVVIALSVGIGGDTDTVGSMAGAISGALNDATNPQEEWYPADPTVWASLENRTDQGLMGRDWILAAAAKLAGHPLTEVRFPGTGRSAASCGPRTPADKAAELCGAYWRTPFRSDGFDAFRQQLFATVSPSQLAQKLDEVPVVAAPTAATSSFRQVAPMMFNRLNRPDLVDRVVAAFEVATSEGKEGSVMSEAQWMALTDPKNYESTTTENN